jgi:hypothetical protein
MPIAIWLLLGGVLTYLVVKSGQTAAATSSTSLTPGPVTSTGTINLSVSGPKGMGPFSVPVESTLPQALQTQFASFFLNADQPSFSDQTVLAFSNQLAGLGYSIAAGSAQSVWQMVVAGLNAQQPTQTQQGGASSSACPPGTHPPTFAERIGGLGNQPCVPDKSSGSALVPEVVRLPSGVTFSKIPSPPTSQ